MPRLSLIILSLSIPFLVAGCPLVATHEIVSGKLEEVMIEVSLTFPLHEDIDLTSSNSTATARPPARPEGISTGNPVPNTSASVVTDLVVSKTAVVAADRGSKVTTMPVAGTDTQLTRLNITSSNPDWLGPGIFVNTTTSMPSLAFATSTIKGTSNDNANQLTVSTAASETSSCEGNTTVCTGDITFFEGGLGACGWNVDTSSDMQIALPYSFMGNQSNGNPYCGRSLIIRNPTTGQTATATVGDKCGGCFGRSIDLTEALFHLVGGGCDGRCSGFEWWFDPPW